MFLFFFSWCGDRRDLHSFPTRRSSDLSQLSADAKDHCGRGPENRLKAIEVWTCPGCSPRGAGRSEEHTSELQAQSKLVCRLLLEKKNSRCCAMPICRSKHRRCACLRWC